ncbi:MAG: hypothetical protein CEE43_17150 [Promethearchaeota archaeon Loki_b32]|nr:MAG: hypothetical protein CEE43_17150 [Candidatus Lokiarchaeota archaeon Loki_b32]
MQKSTFRLFLILLVVLTIAFVAKANPAEYLNNPTFTGDITGWTVVYDVQGAGSIAYDGTYYHGGTAGSLKGVTGVAKGSVMQGYAWQSIGTEINLDDVVKLSLQWSKRSVVSTASGINILKAEITRPSLPDDWVEIWRCDESLPLVDGATAWTGPSELDVSDFFDETGSYKFRWYFDLKSGNNNSAQAIAWFDTTSLDVSAGVSLTCDFSTTTASFGELTTSVVSTAYGSTTINVISADTVFIKVQDDGDGVDPGLWKSSATTDLIGSANEASGNTATLEAGTEGYGMQATSTNEGSGAEFTIAVRYDYASTTNTVGGFEITDVTMASTTGAVTNRRVIMYYKAAINASNVMGSYSDTITYTCSMSE